MQRRIPMQHSCHAVGDEAGLLAPDHLRQQQVAGVQPARRDCGLQVRAGRRRRLGSSLFRGGCQAAAEATACMEPKVGVRWVDGVRDALGLQSARDRLQE